MVGRRRKETDSMYQFFVDGEQVQAETIYITGSDVNHIRNVLRMRNGERVRISDGSGESWFCSIAEITENMVSCDILEKDRAGTELPVQITLYQGLPKADKMELIIQKSVELGVYRIVPVAMKNCVMKLEPKKAENKIHRWQAIAESAAKQSKRTVIPEIGMPLNWKAALEQAFENDVLLVPYENERGMDATREIIRSIIPGQTVGIIIGPEGGFSQNEIEQIQERKLRKNKESNEGNEAKKAKDGKEGKEADDLLHAPAASEADETTEEKLESEEAAAGGHETAAGRRQTESCADAHLISLGRRILRTETAGPAALAMLVYELDR